MIAPHNITRGASMSNSTTDHRYLVKPGYVRSRSDGDLHYIGFAKLVGLYGVPLIECLHFDEARLHGYTKEYIDGLTVLEPQESGDYEL